MTISRLDIAENLISNLQDKSEKTPKAPQEKVKQSLTAKISKAVKPKMQFLWGRLHPGKQGTWDLNKTHMKILGEIIQLKQN